MVDEVLSFVGNQKPVKRLLLNALDEKTIKSALQNLKENRDYQVLKECALVRGRIDWLLGMNGTRAVTLAARAQGHRTVYNIGRVKTPTLALVVRRERQIENFKPTPYFTIIGFFKTAANEPIQAKWKAGAQQKGLDVEGRLIDPIYCREIIDKCSSGERKCTISSYEIKEKTETHRLPFSLSALQIQAGKTFGYEPQQVLNLCQALYEKKYTTYPRSDCDYLPENQHEAAPQILHNLKLTGNADLAAWAGHATIDPKRKSRAWNDQKVSAHHAIIPTEAPCDLDKLTKDEKNIYFLVARSYILQFLPEHKYNQTSIGITCADELFSASGRTVLEPGWKLVYQKEQQAEEEGGDQERQLPKLKEGATVTLLKATPQEAQTKAPPRFTPATLLGAMKEIAKYLKDDKLKSSLQSVGLGTEATRAGIIDDLLKKGFLAKNKKNILPSEKAYTLIEHLPDHLTWPDTTALMEQKLQFLEQGKTGIDDILNAQISDMVVLCNEVKEIQFPRDESAVACPVCGQGSLRKRKGSRGDFWSCSRYPDCKATYPDKNDQPDMTPPKEVDCPGCGGKLRLRTTKDGKKKFWSCMNWKEGCQISFDDYRGKPVIHPCPKCEQGYLRKLGGKNGLFWLCKNCSTGFDDSKGKPDLTKK